MQFNPSQIPAGIDTIEKLLVWAAMCLENRVGASAAGYLPMELNNSGVPTTPIYHNIGRIQSGPNYGRSLYSCGANIFLDDATLYAGDIFLSAAPFDATDTIPGRFDGAA